MTACLSKDRSTRAVEALLHLAGDGVQVLAWSTRPWASVTFTGERLCVTLDFPGAAAVAGEVFVSELPEHEFTLAGSLVADAAIAWVNRQVSPVERLTCQAELLLLDED